MLCIKGREWKKMKKVNCRYNEKEVLFMAQDLLTLSKVMKNVIS